MRRSERALSQLPPALLLGFLVLLGVQLAYHHYSSSLFDIGYQPLAKPMAAGTYRQTAMGSEQLLGYLLAIRLQMHDNQAGRHFRYSLIDYDVLLDWLEQISSLSPGTEYPMLLASRIYTQTNDPVRLRKILGFIERYFDDEPQLHWRRLAEASLIAKHKLGDLELALRLARKLSTQPATIRMPQWARDFELLLLAELNELESAIAIIEALLSSDAIHDPDERLFLEQKLLEFQQKLFISQQ